MIEINNPKIDMAQIKARIAEEMARYADMDEPDPGMEEESSADRSLYVLPGSPAPADKSRLLGLYGEAFINEAYQAILGREPDDDGGRVYLEKLMTGRLTRVDILGRLRYSREGRFARVKVPGLLPSFLVHSFFKIPVLGWAARVVFGVLNFPGLVRYIQRMENQAVERHRHLEEHLDAARSQIRDLKEDLAEIRNETRQSHLAMTEQIAAQKERIEEQKIMLLDTQHSFRNLLDEPRTGSSDMQPDFPLAAWKPEHLLDGTYVAFENRFRGTTAEIKQRLSVYLSHVNRTVALTSCRQVLDVGCGRGEWLELLRENQIQAAGLDLNRMMVDICTKSGLDAVQADAVDYLRAQAPESFGVVTGFHIVEHLPFDTLIALLDESRRVLAPGGMVIFETPNPENIQVGACDFYTDPTHRNPIPPHTLSYLVEARGFSDPRILRLHPPEGITIEDPFLNHLFNVGRDYAVIGCKK